MEQPWPEGLRDGEAVELWLLGRGAERLTARIERLSGNLGCLVTQHPVTIGESVRVELAREMLLGEVTACNPVGGAWHSRIEFAHSLKFSSELDALAAALGFSATGPLPEARELNRAEALHARQQGE